jgi:hypothetical protein
MKGRIWRDAIETSSILSKCFPNEAVNLGFSSFRTLSNNLVEDFNVVIWGNTVKGFPRLQKHTMMARDDAVPESYINKGITKGIYSKRNNLFQSQTNK